MSVLPQSFYSLNVAVSAASTPQQVQPQPTAPGSGAPHTTGAIIKADSANTAAVYLGGPGVTAAQGYPLAAGETVAFDANGLGKLWMLSTATGAGATLHVLLTGP